METPVSAFAMYKANTSSNKEKKNKKRNKGKPQVISPKATSRSLPPQLKDEKKQIELALKLKKKNKKVKESKNIIKKKQHKKKRSKLSKPETKVSPARKSTKQVLNSSDVPDSHEDVPLLLKPPAKKEVPDLESADEVCSHSSDGSFEFTPVETDSEEEGLKVFKWMIAPYDIDEFFANVWEKKPLHIARGKHDFYKELITTPIIDDMLRNEHIQFTKNIDVTSYVDGERQTHNPEGRAHPHLVWDFYLNGCSVRLLNPQTYIPRLHLMNTAMQEFFNSFVGANAYLTPPDSQGFAPHYDDIEAFILQTEGKKHWRVYKPLNEGEVLPRVSSKNYQQDEIGKPILEVTLEAGDMLYFPRGYIHQGVTIDGEHSLHVTISMYQKHSWADLFEKLMPAALQIAISENVELRQGLPFDIYNHFGLVHSDSQTPRKKEITKMILSLFEKIKQTLPIDDAVDQMHKNYQHAALPPVINDLEKAVTVFGDSDVMIADGIVTNRVEICPDTRIRLLRKNILRMVSEDKIRVYYYVENSLEYHGNELPYLEIEEELAPGIETLITAYPEYVAVENLDLPNDSDKLSLADALWGRGLIMTEYPLENVEDD
ncbi:bifunctional lysine-specific demethylase and histidyl-hydroxylase NO66 [Helicoverpa zea]|uniref:bifunctional lysine-specific demethylase and histidyl-hydroxylase NO66 n=1 Tax=Helicoverpa zea TaxID=7113 RepID=UPI001F58F389|nr:bifunctional lysine-specific demethylase and histidyl-hydroxylase NO66 [Helicoverpa zea]